MHNISSVPESDKVTLKDGEENAVFLAINHLDILKIKGMEFEQLYDNSLKYALIPETKEKGYNSNSYFRGVLLKYAGLLKHLEVPSCFKSPGLSKTVDLNVGY